MNEMNLRMAKELLKIAKELIAVENNVKRWYKKAYPKDELGDEIKSNITFDQTYKALKNGIGRNFYNYMGSGIDSIVREHIFAELSKRYKIDYEVIYDWWLHGGEKNN